VGKRVDAAETIAPNPSDLVESLRDFGYTLPTAVADLIDNSVAANASAVHVTVESSGPQVHVAIVDNGSGMSLDRLVEAMRMGAGVPAHERKKSDLGRFGLGLKTASLSIGRCLTVVTKRIGAKGPSIRRWDLEHIRESGSWTLLSEPTAVGRLYVEKIAAQESGTAVIIERLDRAGYLRVPDNVKQSHLADALQELSSHLGMVFHRFIEDGLTIKLGATAVKSWDPFMKSKSFQLPIDRIRYLDSDILVTPFVLPHHSKLTDSEFDEASGLSGWNAHQGFYIYRCKRLIVPGAWLNLGLKKEEHFKLARIQVDLPNTLDSDWKLNVIKSHVSAPPALRDTFARIARDVRHNASNVYRHRGERDVSLPGGAARGFWKRLDSKRKVQFRLDRTHPVLYALLNAEGAASRLFADALALIEQSLPIDSILQVPHKSLEDTVSSEESVSVDALVELARSVESFYVRAGVEPDDARHRVLSVEPLVRHRDEILARIDKFASADERDCR
jgi:hypothetical protein